MVDEWGRVTTAIGTPSAKTLDGNADVVGVGKMPVTFWVTMVGLLIVLRILYESGSKA